MYKVKAIYDYSSPHEDDLDFKVGQIISVTEEEGDDWYVGEYTDDSGIKRDGLFPRNFVERYEPAPPPRPNRASRHKPMEQPPAQEAPPMPQLSPSEPEPAPAPRQEPEAPKPQPPPIEVPAAAKSTPLPMSPISPPSASSARAQEALHGQSESPKPAPPAKKVPPPVASKSNAFRDRIAAFNAPAAAPIQPFKPSGPPTNFIKKPFVAPPPSRNAYIPPTRETPPIKTYRREEDPEIAARQAQDQNDAERAGLAQGGPKDEGEEEQQPKVSLKERIALLQKQQQEQAERAAAMHKEKPKRPPVAKRTQSQDAQAEDSENTDLERVVSGASKSRPSMDQTRPPRSSHDIKSPNRELLSENDADQSGAGETEDAGGESTSRMAKMSGGMGMPGMFGGPPMAPLPPKKKKPILDKKPEETEEYSSPQQRIPMFGLPGMPPVRSPEPAEDRTLYVEKEEEGVLYLLQYLQHVKSPGPGSESGDELTDGPDVKTPPAPFSPATAARRASYFATGEQPHDMSERRVPPLPLADPASPHATRPPPPPPPTQAPPSRHGELPIRKLDRTEGETDYEGDYDTDIAPDATHKDALKSHARSSSLEDNATDEPASARSPTIPHGMPPLPPTGPRAVPPPPPVPSRTSTDVPRGVPPPPPGPPPARSMPVDEDDDDYDPFRYVGPPGAAPAAPRAVPPPPQSQPAPPQNRPPPPLPPSIPPLPSREPPQSDDEDDLYSSPPRKSHDKPPPPPQAPPHQHAPPPPPHLNVPPPPPQEKAAPPRPQERPVSMMPTMEQQNRVLSNRKSLDVSAMMGRGSMDQLRPASNQDFIASDIDLGMGSHWWTQPNLLPPSLQGRKDVLVDMKESQTGNTIEKIIKVLYLDYSQTVISARFEANNVSDVEFEQRNDPPPARQRPDQLESAYEQFGRQIAKAIESKQNTVVGNGTPHGLIEELLKPLFDALPPVSTRSFGALVYANLANASTQSYDEIRPGDIITFRNAKFQGKTGPMHARYAVDVGKPDHVGVVVEWDGSKKKVRAWEQGREHKKVKPESFKMGDLRSGEVRVWRVMSKSWVGWN
ncbi:SH3 domain containing protein [Pyrenophora tritici-repentis]|nr:SH3 domain containing protein [Pyrenophora tritici-repentis]KAI1553532.1 SH3 domain containing protein [Pyrenophora tritici-repentis]KAI1607595.1 SH3 domain containing protein [Pyrenophora tritici-repentis]PZD01613.1 SH3 domain containing protein [Pyrenophora tritici-repentis]